MRIICLVALLLASNALAETKDQAEKTANRRVKYITGFANLKKWVMRETPSSERFTIDGMATDFLTYPTVQLTISSGCRLTDKKLKCKSFNGLKRVSTTKMDWKELDGGRNPGSLLCLKVGGRVRFSLDAQQNMRNFCQFEDSSIIDTASLFYFWKIQKRNQPLRVTAGAPEPAK